MRAGIHNLGFVAVSAAGVPWLDFWQERLFTDAIVDVPEQLFGDQRWSDWAPTLFDHVTLTDPGLNVAYWNIDERGLERTPNGYRCLGQPLRMSRYAGYRPSKPWCLSDAVADAPRVLVSENPALADLLGEYDALLGGSDPEDAETIPYRYGAFADGAEITPQMRRLYRSNLLAARRPRSNMRVAEPPIPDHHNGFENLASWLSEPSERMPRLTRLAYAIWDSRVDLQGTFPLPQTASREAFATWLRTYGVREGYVNRAWETAIRPIHVEPRPLVSDAGCHVFGYFSSVLGVGTTGRLAVAALERAGLPVDVHASSQTHSPKAIDFEEKRSLVRYPINVVAMNADMFPLWVEQWGPEFASDAYTIGLWAWELEDFPASMHGAFDHVDEIWAFSDFNAESFRRQTDLPVYVFPVRAEAAPERPWPQLAGIDPERGYFLFVFDYLSEVERKNPMGLMSAYRSAFPDGDGPALLIKSINGEQRRTEREMVRREASTTPGVQLIEHFLPAPELEALVQHAIAFVSLHRSEGFGLGLMEAMAQGTPVIATGYSGNLTFMDEENSLLVPYTMVAASDSAGYYNGLGDWADPDVAAAAAALRRLAEDRTLAEDLGRRAQQDILARFSPDRAAAFVRSRVDDIMAARAEQERIAAQERAAQQTPVPPSLGQRLAGRLRRGIARGN